MQHRNLRLNVSTKDDESLNPTSILLLINTISFYIVYFLKDKKSNNIYNYMKTKHKKKLCLRIRMAWIFNKMVTSYLKWQIYSNIERFFFSIWASIAKASNKYSRKIQFQEWYSINTECPILIWHFYPLDES